MRKTLTLLSTAATLAAAVLVPAGPAAAQRGYGYHQQTRGYDYDRRDRGYEDARDYRDDRRGYRGRDAYRDDRRCTNGGTGLLLGAIAGGLLGRSVDTRGDRTVGTLLGAGLGAVAGREVERGDQRYRCR